MIGSPLLLLFTSTSTDAPVAYVGLYSHVENESLSSPFAEYETMSFAHVQGERLRKPELEFDSMSLSSEDRVVLEGTTPIHTMYLYDAATTPAVIPSANIVSITLTLKNVKTGATVNSRTAQSIFNTNNGTFGSTDGLLTIAWQAADTAIIGTIQPDELEEHRYSITWTYETTKVGRHQGSFYVRQLADL